MLMWLEGLIRLNTVVRTGRTIGGGVNPGVHEPLFVVRGD